MGDSSARSSFERWIYTAKGVDFDFSGERYKPELIDPKISYAKWHRYQFTAKLQIQ